MKIITKLHCIVNMAYVINVMARLISVPYVDIVYKFSLSKILNNYYIVIYSMIIQYMSYNYISNILL